MAMGAGAARAGTGEGPDPTAPPSGAIGTGSGVAPVTPGVFAPGPGGLRLLASAQILNVLRDLFGPGIGLLTGLEAEAPVNGLVAIAGTTAAISERTLEKLEAGAYDVARQVMNNPELRQSLVGCAPGPEDCTLAFLRTFGARLWRRPLLPAELDRYLALTRAAAAQTGDPARGLQFTLAALLLSPNFLYRTELGATDAKGPVRRLDAFEWASRVSFLLNDSAPDEELWRAALAGALTAPAERRRQVERVLNTPAARRGLRALFTDFMRLGDLDELRQQSALFPQKTATLGPAMREETLRTLEDLVFTRDADLRGVFDQTFTFVNAELAKLYGLPAPAKAFDRVALDPSGPRAGLLGQGSFLAGRASATGTSPTKRGKYVREVLLCQTVPAPPDNADTAIPDEVAKNKALTTRRKLEIHRAVPACAGCHALIDPIGVAFEAFNGIGVHRTTEAGQPIDASGELDGLPFKDARGLNVLLAAHPRLGPCVVRTLYRYGVGRVEVDGEALYLDELAARLSGEGFRLRALLIEFVLADAFSMVGAP
jgi:hypothetical protein